MIFVNETSIIFADGFKGAGTFNDLLTSEGTYQITCNVGDFRRGGVFFELVSTSYVFSLSSQNGALVFRRNDYVCILNLDQFSENEKVMMFAAWTHNKMSLCCGNKSREILRVTTETSPISAPPELIKKARMNSLIPVSSFKTKYDFRQRVYSALSTIQAKIHEGDAYKSFWNIKYDGQAIKERSPKTEPEIQPLIHCFLSDQMLVSGIEVIAEPHTGSGKTDFLLVANVTDIGLTKICVEVKLAHSKDLHKGLREQLPEYMKAHKAEFGAYCVLDFKGEWFDKPKLLDGKSLELYLSPPSRQSKGPEEEGIRPFIFSLAKPKTASKD